MIGTRKAHQAALVQLGSLLVTCPSELRDALAVRKTLTGKVALCRRLLTDRSRAAEPLTAAKVALRSLARRIGQLDEEIRELDAQIAPLIEATAPRTLPLFGVGTNHAAQLLISAGENIERLHSEATFAGSTSSPSAACATARRPRPTPHDAPPTAKPDATSSAASNAPLPARSTTH